MTIEKLKRLVKQPIDDIEQPPSTPPTTPDAPQAQPGKKRTLEEQGIEPWYVNKSTGFLQGTSINPQKDLGMSPIKGAEGGMYINRALLSGEQQKILEEDKLKSFGESGAYSTEDAIGEISEHIKSNGELPDLETFFENEEEWGEFVSGLKESLTYHKPIEEKEGMENHSSIDIKGAKGQDKTTTNFNIREMDVGLSYVLLEALGEHLGYNTDDFTDTVENLGDYVGASEEIEGSFLNESKWWQHGKNNPKAAEELRDMLRPFTGVHHSLTNHDEFMEYVEDSNKVPKLDFKYVTPASVYGVITRSRAIGQGSELSGQSKAFLDESSAAKQGLQYQDIMNHISKKFKLPKYYSYGDAYSLPAVDENGNAIYMSREDTKDFVEGYEAWKKDKSKSSITLSDSKNKIDFNTLDKKTTKTKFFEGSKEMEVNALRNMYTRQKHFMSHETHHTMSDEELKNTSLGKAFDMKKRRRHGDIKQKEVFSDSLEDFSGAKGHNALVGLDISYGLSHLLTTNQEKHDEMVNKLTNNALGEEGLFFDVEEKGDAEKKLNLVNNLNKRLLGTLSTEDQETLKQSADGFRDTLVNHQFKTNEQFLNLVAPDTDYVPIYRGIKDVIESLGTPPSKNLYELIDSTIDKETLGAMNIGALNSHYGVDEEPKEGHPVRRRGNPDYEKGIAIKPQSTLLTGGTQNPDMTMAFAGSLDTGNIIVSKVPKSDFFHLPSLSSATKYQKEHEAIYLNRPSTQAKLVTKSRISEGKDFQRHPMGIIPKEIWDDFDTPEKITKGETFMKEERKEPLEVMIPNFRPDTSDKDIQEALESYMAAIKTKNEITKKLVEENSDS